MMSVLVPILLCTLLAFAPSVVNHFVNWDDGQTLLHNPLIKPLSFETISRIFTTHSMGNYHPLTTLSFAWEHQWAGFNPLIYHVDNLILHVINTTLVYVLIMALTKEVMTAQAVSLLFGIHPLHVESVAWVTERKDVLYAMFYLLALISYQRRKMGLVSVFFVLSLLSKVQAVTLPAALLLLDYWNQRSDVKRMVVEKWFLWLGSCVFIGAALVGGQSKGAFHMMEAYTGMERLVLGFGALVQYAVKLVIPYQVSSFYPFPPKNAGFYALGISGVLLVAGMVYILRHRRTMMFGFLFFLVHIALGLQVVPVGHAYLADRFTYMASIGIFLMAAQILKHRHFLPWAAAAYILCLGFITFDRCRVWYHGGTLWSDVIRQFPGEPEPLLWRGNFWMEQGNIPKALEDYSSTIARHPDFAKAYVHRGNAYQRMGNMDLAVADFDQALRLRPQGMDILLNRANALAQSGKVDEAMRDYNFFLEKFPNSAQGYYNRGVLHLSLQKVTEAQSDFQKARQMGMSF